MKKAFLSLLLVVTMLMTMVMPLVSHAGTSVTTNYIMFDLNGGTTSASQTLLQYLFWADDVNPFSVVFSSASGYDAILEALYATTVKSGYRLAGFKCAYNGNTYTSVSDLKNSTDEFPAAPETVLHTFTAVWEEVDTSGVTYTVTLKSGKGGLGTGVTLTKYHGQDLALFTNKDYIKSQYDLYPGTGAEGYGEQRVLIEWNTAYDSTTGKGTGVAFRDVYNVDANITLYAIWGYNIQYNADGGIFPATGNSIFLKYVCDSDNSNYQNPMTLYGNFDMPVGSYAPTKAGCRRVNMDDGTEFYGLLNADMSFFTTETTAQNLTIPPTGHKMPWSSFHCATTSTGYPAVEFYAIWEPSVTYKANGGSGTEYSEYLDWDWGPLHYYNSYSVDSCSFSKSGTYFVGWNTMPDGSGTSYSVGANLGGQRANSDPIVLYAQWADGSSSHTCSYTASVTTAATCTTAGVMTYTCSCGASYTQAIPATGHNFVNYYSDDNATCTADGTKTSYCANNCGTADTVADPGSVLGHSFNEYYSNGDATCTVDGTETARCIRCTVTDTRTAAGSATGHDFSVLVGQYPQDDCTEEITGVYQCTKCGEYIEQAIPGSAKEHTPIEQKFNESAPTCTEAGSYESLVSCDVCGATISYDMVSVPATGHTPVVTPAVEPTCTENGKTEASYCSVCSDTLSVSVVIPAKGHSYSKTVTAPTCTEEGYTTYTCTVCGYTYKDNSVAANGHTEVVDEAVEATCTTEGLTEGKHCSVCNEVIVAQTVVAATGHSYNAVVTAPTCTEVGYTTYTCSDCGDSYVSDNTAANGHTIITQPAVEATCTEEGLTEGKHCTVCGTVTVAQEVIVAKGHTYGEWYTTVEPTTEAVGEERRDCANCDVYETNVLPKLEEVLPEDAPILTAKNYNIMLTKADTLTYIRYAKGTYATGSEIKAAADCVTLGASKIVSFTTDGVCTLEMADGGIYSVWVKTTEGKEYVYHVDLTFMEQTVDTYGVSITVNNLYGVKDYFICPGDYDNYSDIKANYLVLVTANKINGAHSYKYIVPNPGRYTIYIRYEDSTRPATILKTDCVVAEPAFNGNGLQFTVSNLDDVKVIRTAYGEYSTPGDVKRAEGQRSFSAKDRSLKGKTEFTIQYRENGTVTVAVVYNHGYEVMYTYEVQQKVPSFVQNGNTVTFGQLDDLLLVRYAEGTYTTSNQIKNAESSKAIKADAIVDGFITVTLDPGTYTFCVQYLDESYNYYVVTVEDSVSEETYPGYGKDWTITFDTVGGEMPEGIDTMLGINYGESYREAAGYDYPVPTLDGYTFEGWYLSSYNFILTSGDWDTGYYALNESIVLEALWA